MYLIHIFKEIKSDNYKKLIDYASLKSDAVMLATNRFTGKIEQAFTTPDRKKFDSEKLYILVLKSIEQAKREKYKEEDIFKNSTETFLEKLKPYLIKKRYSPNEWPGTILGTGTCEYLTYEINVYRLCKEMKEYLVEPNSLFDWKYPYFPDDLSFFKNGNCWFYTVAHEGYAYIFTKEIEDVEKLKELEIEFKVCEYRDDEVKLFHEEYNL